MQPQESYGGFRAYLKERKRTLKSLNVPDACQFMFDFYRTVRSVGTCGPMGDGIAHVCEICALSHGTPLELSIYRLFAVNESKPGIGGSRLRLSLGYQWTTALLWFTDRSLPRVPSKLVWRPEEATKLLEELRTHEIYTVLSQHTPRSGELRHEPIWNNWA